VSTQLRQLAVGIVIVLAAWLAALAGLSWLIEGGAASLIGSAGAQLVLALVIGVPALVLGARVRTRARCIGGPRMILHTRGNDSWEVAAWHEAGHIRMAKRVGGTVSGAEIYPNGAGVTYLRLPRTATPVQQVAVDVSGEVGSGTAAGCDSDHRYMRQVLAKLPAADRPTTKAEGYRLARRECTRSALASTARTLIDKGRC
jgi:Peptidase M50B-like